MNIGKPPKCEQTLGNSERRLDDLAAENAELKARLANLETLVMRDTLTPLFNRRHFMEALESWRTRAQRHSSQYGIIYVDVDSLKAINDSFGHSAGDELLITVAEILQENIRRFDVAARIGGDEFAILLDDMSEDDVIRKMTALQQKVAASTLHFGDHKVQPQISLGCAMVDPKQGVTALLALADADMYARRQAAKNSQINS